MANPRKFSEKIALHNQRQAEETAAFEQIMQEVSAATNMVSSTGRQARIKAPPELKKSDSTLKPSQQSLGNYRSGSLPNVAAPQATKVEPENNQPEEAILTTQYVQGGRSVGTSPSRAPAQRSRAPASVGPMRNRPAERRHDTSPYGSSVYLSPPSDSSWRRTNSDSALHQSCETSPAALSPHHPLHSHAHPHHQNHRRSEVHLDVFNNMGVTQVSRPRSSCEIPRMPNNTNVYPSGAGGLTCAELQVPGGSLPDLTSVHYPPPHGYPRPPHADNAHHYRHQSPPSPGGVSAGGSGSPATGGLSPASGSPVGATVPPLDTHANIDALYDAQNHLSVPNTNNYLHQNKNISQLDHSWITSSYQSHCSPPSQYSSTSNINIPSPTMVHSPGSPVESPGQADYSHLLQPFQEITMLDGPPSNYSASYMNHSSPHSPQTTNSYSQSVPSPLRAERDPVAGGNGPVFPPLQTFSAPDTPIPDIILTDYSSELEEAQLRAELDLVDLPLLDEPGALLPDSAVEHGFRLDRL